MACAIHRLSFMRHRANFFRLITGSVAIWEGRVESLLWKEHWMDRMDQAWWTHFYWLLCLGSWKVIKGDNAIRIENLFQKFFLVFSWQWRLMSWNEFEKYIQTGGLRGLRFFVSNFSMQRNLDCTKKIWDNKSGQWDNVTQSFKRWRR